MSSIGSYSAQNELDAGLWDTRGGESVWLLVLVGGVANDQASMSFRTSETPNGSSLRGSARGTTMESGLRNDACDTAYIEGAGSLRGSRAVAGAASRGSARREGGGVRGREIREGLGHTAAASRAGLYLCSSYEVVGRESGRAGLFEGTRRDSLAQLARVPQHILLFFLLPFL